jgi:hypothetical protein
MNVEQEFVEIFRLLANIGSNYPFGILLALFSYFKVIVANAIEVLLSVQWHRLRHASSKLSFSFAAEAS